MGLKFTNHAKFRILERRISMIDIKSAIKNPDHSKHVFDGKIAVRKNFSGYSLEVIYKKVTKNDIVVITAYKI